jgi:HlyD family secretion protein
MRAKTVWGVLAAFALGALWLTSATAQDRQVVHGTGAIEAEVIEVSSVIPARIASLLVDEGAQVQAGQMLAELESQDLQALLRQAEDALALAQAKRAQLLAPPAPPELAKAEGELLQARAARDGAEQVLRQAIALLRNPLELQRKVTAAEGQIALLEAQVEQAKAALHQAELVRDEAARRQTNDEEATRYQAAVKQAEAAAEELAAAQAELEGAQEALRLLQAMRAEPLPLIVSARRAQGAYRQAEAALALAEARLALVRAGPTREELAIAEAEVRKAEATLAQVQAQLDQTRLTAPRAGTVQRRLLNVGELAIPGAPVLTLADLQEVKLRLYVPAREVGRIRVGDEARVRVDAYPGVDFRGTVAHVADEAIFTPKNVQTAEGRERLMFAVDIVLPNRDGRLKAGMQADAWIEVSR